MSSGSACSRMISANPPTSLGPVRGRRMSGRGLIDHLRELFNDLADRSAAFDLPVRGHGRGFRFADRGWSLGLIDLLCLRLGFLAGLVQMIGHLVGRRFAAAEFRDARRFAWERTMRHRKGLGFVAHQRQYDPLDWRRDEAD